MTPGTTADRFDLMVSTLTGEPLPEPPPLPGRVHRAPIPDGRDPLAEQHDALEVRLPPGWWARP